MVATKKKPAKRYFLHWRNKFLTSEATSLSEMIAALGQAQDALKEMLAAGVELDAGSGSMEDDYAHLVTTDKTVAKKYGFMLDS